MPFSNLQQFVLGHLVKWFLVVFLDSIHVLPFAQLGFKRLGCLAFAYTVVIVKNLLEVAQGDAFVGKHRIDSQRHLLGKDNIASGL